MPELNTPTTPQIKPFLPYSMPIDSGMDFSRFKARNSDSSFSSQKAQTEGAIPPLGIRTKSASKSRDKVIKNRLRLQSQAARLMPHHRVAGCLRDMAYKAKSVDVMYSAASESAHLKGLQICGSVWDCPVCAAKITELRRQELTKGIARAKELGLYPVLVTYTMRHKKYQKCADLLKSFNKARRYFKSGQVWQDIKAAHGFVGSVRSKEVTHTQENGWHIHAHEEMLFNHRLEADELLKLETALKRRWVKVADANWKYGLDVQAGHEATNNYVAKFGLEDWTLEHELTKSGVKKASRDGRTPFGLLEAAEAGDLEAGELFKEYSAAFKGQRQLVWTDGLRTLLGLDEVEATDEELAELEQSAAVMVVQLNSHQWRGVVGNDCRAELLEVVRESKGNPDAVWKFLDEIGVTDERDSW